MAEDKWCPVVQGWVERGFFDLKELEEHVTGCAICQRIMAATERGLRGALQDAGMYEAGEGEASD